MKSNQPWQIAVLDQMLFEHENRENDFPVVSDLSELPDKYGGMCLVINDHGNVSAVRAFKCGTTRTLANKV